MSLSNRIQAKAHLYMPGDTVSGVVKKYNMFDVSPEELTLLIEQYKLVNAPGAIKPGMQGLIPILERHYQQVFNQ